MSCCDSKNNSLRFVKECNSCDFTPKTNICNKNDFGKLVRVTNLSRLPPDLGCLRYEELPGETWYRNTEDECWIAINPLNPQNMIIVTHQDRFKNFLANIVLYTLDGGETWNESDLTLSRCQGPTLPTALNDYESASDPHVFFDKKGNAYMNSVSFNSVQDFDEALVLAKSTDGGRSWNHLTEIIRDDGSENFQDRQTGVADPYRVNTLYMAWTDFQGFLVGDNSASNNTKFQKSTDAGSSWSEPLIIDEYFSSDGVLGPWNSLVEVLNDPTQTIAVFTRITTDVPNSNDSLVVNRSKDGGTTWEKTVIATDYRVVVPIDPGTGITVMGYHGQIDVALNKNRNKIYISTYDPRFNNLHQVGTTIIMSSDFGETWSDPVPVNPKTLNVQSFLSSVAVLDNGTVGVLYYDFRNYTEGDASLWTDVWLSLFDPTLKFWLGEVRMTDTSFDSRQFLRRSDVVTPDDPYISALFIGDYIKMISHEKSFLASFVVSNPPFGVGVPAVNIGVYREDEREGVVFPNRQDVVFRKVQLCRTPLETPINLKNIELADPFVPPPIV